MKIMGVVEYDGTNYFGWQKQSNGPSVEEEIEKVLSRIYDSEIKIIGSGRTDRFVHALNQVFHFETEKPFDLSKLLYAVNKLLPDDIIIKSFKMVNEDFHSRFSAKKKHYRYVLAKENSAFRIHYALIYLKPVNKEILNEGMKLFLGKHNFVNYCANNEEDNDYDKEIYDFRLTEDDKSVYFDIYGNGFKRYMVRMIVGTLLALNEGKIDLEYIKSRFVLPLGNNTTYKAQPQGLYLVEVDYD